MASKWAQLRTNPVSVAPAKVTDIEETSPYYFLAKDPAGKILSEGELTRFKIGLPNEYLYAPFKSMAIDKTTMIATIQF